MFMLPFGAELFQLGLTLATVHPLFPILLHHDLHVDPLTFSRIVCTLRLLLLSQLLPFMRHLINDYFPSEAGVINR